MAFNFIKKVFSFGRKQAEEKEQTETRAEELKPLGQSEQAAPAPQEPAPPPPPEPAPAPAEPAAPAIEDTSGVPETIAIEAPPTPVPYHLRVF